MLKNSVFFHATCILVFINAVACLDKTDVTYHIFTLIKYLCTQVIWWILYEKRKELIQLILSIRKIQIFLKVSCNSKLKKRILTASMFSVFVVFGPSVICCIKLLLGDEYPMFFCPLHQSMMTQKHKARVLHFWLLSGFNYAGRSLPYIVTIFYSFYCMGLKRLAKFLERKAKYLLHLSSDGMSKFLDTKNLLFTEDIQMVYFELLKLLARFDDIFSSVVNSFLEILRIETVVFMYLKGRWQFSIIVHSL